MGGSPRKCAPPSPSHRTSERFRRQRVTDHDSRPRVTHRRNWQTIQTPGRVSSLRHRHYSWPLVSPLGNDSRLSSCRFCLTSYLIFLYQHIRRDREPNLLRYYQSDNEFEIHRLFNGQIGGFGAVENLGYHVHRGCELPPSVARCPGRFCRLVLTPDSSSRSRFATPNGIADRVRRSSRRELSRD